MFDVEKVFNQAVALLSDPEVIKKYTKKIDHSNDPYVQTEITAFDRALGGGFKRGKVYNVKCDDPELLSAFYIDITLCACHFDQSTYFLSNLYKDADAFFTPLRHMDNLDFEYPLPLKTLKYYIEYGKVLPENTDKLLLIVEDPDVDVPQLNIPILRTVSKGDADIVISRIASYPNGAKCAHLVIKSEDEDETLTLLCSKEGLISFMPD